LFWRRKRKRRLTPRMMLLELVIKTRSYASRLNMIANRVRLTYMRTKDESLLKLLQDILYVQSALEILAVRLETLATVGLIAREELQIAKQVLAHTRETHGKIQPMIDSILLELENATTAIAAETSMEFELEEAKTKLEPSINMILNQAQAIAEEKLKELTQNNQNP